MKILVEPTPERYDPIINGASVPTRVWRGVSDGLYHVELYVLAIVPDTDYEQDIDAFRESLPPFMRRAREAFHIDTDAVVAAAIEKVTPPHGRERHPMDDEPLPPGFVRIGDYIDALEQASEEDAAALCDARRYFKLLRLWQRAWAYQKARTNAGAETLFFGALAALGPPPL